jgi:ectoine hydroxylase-related dioxygenase (phytanoyl-CoA dioxygenase family)
MVFSRTIGERLNMPMLDKPPRILDQEQIEFFQREGYLIVRGLMTAAEVDTIRTHFEQLVAAGQPIKGYWEPDATATDPLLKYPRVMHPQRWDAFAKQMLLHPKVGEVLRVLLGEEPIATQSMFYFKPPGSRGQALHQDNFYLQVEPQSCIAAWTAIDPSTPENGGLYVVPKTQDLDLACPEEADMTQSFFKHLVRPPKDQKAVPAELQPGDTLFFNGNVIHGSGPNRSKTQWRRSFICHYMPASARCINKNYFPLFNFAGEAVTYEANQSGGPCGIAFPKGTYGA